MDDIFISYSREDKKIVQNLVSKLEEHGYSVWWDTSLIAGDSFSSQIQTKLNNAKCVIVVWSKSSIQSRWVIAEASMAMERDVLLPVSLGNIKIPLPFNQFHTSEISSPLKDNNDLPNNLLRALEKYKSSNFPNKENFKNRNITPKKKIKTQHLLVTLLLFTITILGFIYFQKLEPKNKDLADLENRVSALQKLTTVRFGDEIVQNNEQGKYHSEPTNSNNYQNTPEEFIRNYYDFLNDKKYKTAWSKVSLNWRKSRNDTFDKYLIWWESIENVKVLSLETFLDSIDIATVRVKIEYNFTKKVPKTCEHTFQLKKNTDIEWQLYKQVEESSCYD